MIEAVSSSGAAALEVLRTLWESDAIAPLRQSLSQLPQTRQVMGSLTRAQPAAHSCGAVSVAAGS